MTVLWQHGAVFNGGLGQGESSQSFRPTTTGILHDVRHTHTECLADTTSCSAQTRLKRVLWATDNSTQQTWSRMQTAVLKSKTQTAALATRQAWPQATAAG